MTILNENNLAGNFLIESPTKVTQEKEIILITEHKENSITGISLNKQVDKFLFCRILKSLKIDLSHQQHSEIFNIPVYVGGNDFHDKGFVIHGMDYCNEGTQNLGKSNLCITKNMKILQDIATGIGPKKAIFAIGCVHWSKEHFESQIKNRWLIIKADKKTALNETGISKWNQAILNIGIKPYSFSEFSNC